LNAWKVADWIRIWRGNDPEAHDDEAQDPARSRGGTHSLHPQNGETPEASEVSSSSTTHPLRL